MVIPSGLRHALAKLTVELQRRTRLLVVVELCDADAKGRFTARLMFEEGITWIDPALPTGEEGRLLPSDQAPPEAVRPRRGTRSPTARAPSPAWWSPTAPT